MKDISGFEDIADPNFAAKPNPKTVKEFVTEILDSCFKRKAAWITVPQLPIVGDSSRNRINRALAKATAAWRTSRSFSGKLILPLVFTHQTQINGKTQRNPKVVQAGRCYREAHADGFWVVDASLADDSGSKTLRNTRLPAVICLHQELNLEISSRIRIAGPYWGTNLVLWARELIDHPAIGVGGTYQYYLPGGQASFPSARVALAPLRRRANVAQIRTWLEKTAKIIGVHHPAHKEFEAIQKRLSLLSDQEIAREQVAKFYKEWLDVLAATPRQGRSLALFQDLSNAYALGRSLPEIPNEGTSRRPESVIEPLMLNCL